MNLLFVLMPIITASFVLTFVENIISKITFLLLRNKELHIFSEVNSKSLLLAKRLQDDKKARVVFTDDMNENLKLFRKLYNEEIEDKLTRNEHDRWNAYTRSIGYIHASIEEVKNYYDKTNYYVYYLARMHPALVTFEELYNLSVELSKLTGKNIDMVDSDRKIIKFINEKVEF